MAVIRNVSVLMMINCKFMHCD